MKTDILRIILGGFLLVSCVAGGARASEPDVADEPKVAAKPAMKPAVKPIREAAPPLTNTIKWRTASEQANFAFDVYRGDSEEGPFERITPKPIPGAGTTDEPQSYQFVDVTIETGTSYWYYVEEIGLDGVRARFTPIFQSKPKYPEGHEPEVAEAETDEAKTDEAETGLAETNPAETNPAETDPAETDEASEVDASGDDGSRQVAH